MQFPPTPETLADWRETRERMRQRLQEPDRAHEDALLGHRFAQLRIDDLDDLLRRFDPEGEAAPAA